MSSIDLLRDLISTKQRYLDYSLRDYLEYCSSIRTTVEQLARFNATNDVVRFFEKQFVEEMEVLAKVAKHQFGINADGVKVQYVRNDPPDGIITLADGQQIFIECTSARDSRWENFALDQWRKHRRPISLSGFEGADLGGNRLAGYTIRGKSVDDPEMQEYFVEADVELDILVRHRKLITEKIDKKLRKSWQPRTNWLSIYVNEQMVPGGYACMAPTLEEICEQFKGALLAKHIKAIYFVSNRCDEQHWISFHPTN